MAIEVKVPLLPESISDATVATWHKKAGDAVSRDENIVDLETDKVMLEVPAPSDGILKEIVKGEGSVVQAHEVLAIIEAGISQASERKEVKPTASEKSPPPQNKAVSPTTQQPQASQRTKTLDAGPAARRVAAEHEVDMQQIKGTGKGGRITKENVMAAVQNEPLAASVQQEPVSFGSDRPEKRVPMTRIRLRIAERLLEVKQNTAMLTTFNEVDMSKVMAVRKRYKDAFEKRHRVRLGLMSFFVRACIEALKQSPVVNASIDGNDIVYHGYFDIGVAVSTDRGLVVPVLRNADQMSMAEIESKIVEYAEKARTGKLSLEEMQGGTFTITNGGVFGSLLATPIINSPQCAILGMHKIEERPIAENGQVVIKPMMYLALSYDHRLIDGKESVTFLVNIKNMLEDPSRIMLEV